ncbi:MAG: S-ribosylhomocysteine lyase [Rhodanobacter sp.]|nr:MAG: S-ribosylhomocysteine lyase [Rhodanobacter sp.]TAM09338.1 MAG: S-ribosylhomocysteine lyase [Rhodanobacter sp.]TAM36985.1 MAG: S-ribosylhomocysteine lyase [Rhodanobacter sp.]
MVDVAHLGWPVALVGELDHRLLKAPRLKLRAVHVSPAGSAVYAVDLRVRKPNAGAGLSTAVLHSLEHFLLEGFTRLLPAHFLSVGVMGCQTGFYLGFADEGRVAVLGDALATLLAGVATATAVPYARVDQCGNWQNHDLAGAQAVAAEILAARPVWLDAA